MSSRFLTNVFGLNNEEFVLPLAILFFNSIKSFIALQLFNENIFTRINNQNDDFVIKALEEIKSPKPIF